MAGLTITIGIKAGDIELTYDPPLPARSRNPTVEEGEEITFVATGKVIKWAVEFCPSNAAVNAQGEAKERSPFKSKRLTATGPGAKKGAKVEKGRGGSKPGTSTSYSYAVAALDDKLGLYALDPDIRVRGRQVAKKAAKKPAKKPARKKR